MAVLLFVSCPLSVYATDEHPWEGGLGLQLYYNLDEIKQYIKETKDFWVYAAHQLGALVKSDFTKFMNNSDKFDELCSDNNVGLYKDDAGNVKGVYLSKEFMSQLKAILDDYAKENEPYYIGKTYAFDTADFSLLTGNRNVYNTIKNLLNESTSGFIVCSFKSGDIWFADIDRNFSDLSFVKVRGNDRFIGIYDNETWKRLDWTVYRVRLGAEDEEIKTVAEFKEKAISTYSGNRYDYALTQESKILLPQDAELWKGGNCTLYLWPYLVSGETRRIRVFNDFADFQNYTLGKRSVYYTNNYYNYVPEDLTTSIDDLQQTVDGLSGVIDQLLGQITPDTDESEIEDLLKQILDELKNNQGTGGGDGSGGGDVNVDIDLSSTNTLLSKILAKITQISDQISSSAGQTMTDVVESISNLGEMLKKYLIAITGDLDDIKGKLEQMTEEEFNEKTDSFLNETTDSFSEIAEVAKGKFPFSIPNDMRTLLEKLSLPPPSPETAALYSTGTAGAVPYSGDHGGGGASRPPGGISSIEQGSGGGSFGISENGAPVIRCPIVLERLGIDYAIKIDLSEFDKVAAISRALLTFLFIYGLYNLTFKVIGLWGDLTE